MPVRARVVVVVGYSAHADAKEMIGWLGTVRPPSVAHVVHGEATAAAALADRLAVDLGWNAVVPEHLEKVRL